MTAPRDEAGALLEALLAGRWRRLSDPLLEGVLLVWPDAWPEVVEACGSSVADEATQRAALRAFFLAIHVARLLRLGPEHTAGLLDLVPRSPSLTWLGEAARCRPLETPQERAVEALRRAREAVDRCQARTGPAPDLAAALVVLERWPA